MTFLHVPLIGLLVVAAVQSFASPSKLTYQGRIVASDGKPLEYNSVSFSFEITSPNGSCVIYRELRSGIDMSNSGGVFDIPIGSGVRQYPALGSWVVTDFFDNTKTYNCGDNNNDDSGSTYVASSGDGRKLRVRFWDGLGWKLISPDNEIRSVPFASYASTAEKVGNIPAANIAKKSDLPSVNCGANEVLTFTSNAFACLPMSTVELSSYVAHDDLPTNCSASKTLVFVSPANTFSCQDIAISASQVSGLAASATTDTTNASNISSGTLNAARLPSSVTDALWTADSSDIYRASGKVGIGTTTPEELLHVNGKIRASQLCYLDGTNCKDISTGWGSVAGGGFDAYQSRNANTTYTASTDGIVVAYSFETSAGHCYLYGLVNSVIVTDSSFRDNYAGVTRGSISFPVPKGATYSVDTSACGTTKVSFVPLTVGEGGSPWNPSGNDISYSVGNVGLGTTTPSEKLEVNGNIKVAGSGNGIIFPDGTSMTTAAWECTDVTATGAVTASVSCPADYPRALRGGCKSVCMPLTENDIVGGTQTCSVASYVKSQNFCVAAGQSDVTARITCCK